MDAAKPSGAPLQLSVEATSSTSLQLSWDLPNKWKRNGEIIGYKLSYKRAEATEKKQVKNLDKKTNIKLQGLNKFTTYKLWIQAKTVAGLGPAAEFQEATKQDGEINCTKYCVVLNCTKCCIVKLYCLYMYYSIMALNLANVHCG